MRKAHQDLADAAVRDWRDVFPASASRTLSAPVNIESRDMESYLSIDFRYSFNEMKVNNMPPPINATIVPPATNRNKIAPKFESMLPIELSFRPLVKGRAIRTGMCQPAGSGPLLLSAICFLAAYTLDAAAPLIPMGLTLVDCHLKFHPSI